MYVGTQLKARNDDDYKVFAQLGLKHICGYPPGEPEDWTVENLTRYREHVESFGLTLDVIPLPLNSHEISRAVSRFVSCSPWETKAKACCQISATSSKVAALYRA